MIQNRSRPELAEDIIDLMGKDLAKIKMLVDSCFSLGESSNRAIAEKVTRVDDAIFRYYRDSLEAEAEAENDDEKLDENGFPKRIVAPDSVVAEQCEKLFGYLSDAFLIADPLFNIPTIPNQSRLTSAVSDYITRNSNTNLWRVDLQQAIQDSIWYNNGPLEVYIDNGEIKLKAIRPTKTIQDLSVDSSKGLKDSSYYGYEETLSLVQAANLLKSKAEFLSEVGKELDDDIFKIFTKKFMIESSSDKCYSTKYQKVNTAPKSQLFNDELDFSYYMSDKKLEDTAPITKIACKVLYKRLTPSWVGADILQGTNVSGYELPLFRIVCFNGIPVVVQNVSDSSSVMVFAATYLDSENAIDTHSHAERLIPVQTYSAKLQTARMIGLRELLSDSYIHNEEYVEINGQIKTIKSNALVDKGLSIDQVYRRDNKDLNELGALLGALGGVQDFADKVSGNNPAVNGQHVVGNRTAAESQKLVTTAESRYNLRKLMIQQTLFEPLQRAIVKMCIINRTHIRYFDKETENLVSPSAAELSLVSYYLDIGDGGLPSSDTISPESVQALMVLAAQNQTITQEYDAGDLFKQFAISLGFKRIHDVRKAHAPNDELGVERPNQQGVPNPNQLPPNQGQQVPTDQVGQQIPPDGNTDGTQVV